MTEMNTVNQTPQPEVQPQPVAQPASQPEVQAQPVTQPAPQPADASFQQTASQNTFVPPAGQVPPYQPYGAPVPPPVQPGQPVPGMPLMALTGGMKAAWFFVGLLLGPVGILLAWLFNVTNFPEAKSAAIKFSLIGCVAAVVAGFLLGMFLSMSMFAFMSSWY